MKPRCCVRKRNVGVSSFRNMNKTLHIDVEIAKAALLDKRQLDALCLNLKIKFMFRSSALVFTTYKETSEKLGMGKDKLKKVLDDAMTYGYIRKNVLPNGELRYTATKIRKDKQYSYKVNVEELRNLTFPQLKNLLRKVVLENHIAKLQDTSDTHARGTNPTSVNDIRRMRKRESRMLRKPYNENYIGLSYYRIAELLGVSRRKACQIVREMCLRGDINKVLRCTEFGCDPKACTYTHSYTDGKGGIIVISARYRLGCLVCSNTYTCKNSHICLTNKKSYGKEQKCAL